MCGRSLCTSWRKRVRDAEHAMRTPQEHHQSNMARLIMKVGPIAVGLVAIVSQAPPAWARAGPHPEDPWNRQHVEGLPPGVRSTVAQVCRDARAQHPFAGYFQNSRFLVLHFEHARCGNRGALCTQAGCLHQVYISKGGHYRLLKSYYAPGRD